MPNSLSSRERAAVTHVVVAGPSSQVTLPGVMTAEVVGLLAPIAQVTRIDVDTNKDFESGLHRAPTLSGSYQRSHHVINSLRVPLAARHRRTAMRPYFNDQTNLAVALAWPGLNNTWIGDFVRVAGESRTPTVVLVVTHPTSPTQMSLLAREVADADLVLVGDVMEAALLSTTLGTTRPVIEVQRALSLAGRKGDRDKKIVTTFLQRDDSESLTSVLAAFDAIPEKWIGDYAMRVVMHFSGSNIPQSITDSFHADHVELVGDDLSETDLASMADESSAFSLGDPTIDSRVFSTAMDQGIVTAVLADGMNPNVAESYVGAVIGDVRRPASVHVAMAHALRMSDLRFPGPRDWFELASRLDNVARGELSSSSEVPSTTVV